MEFFKVVLKRRSIRRFKSERIPKHMVDRILECAMYAPSARNRRPVHLVVVEDNGTIESLRRLREGAFSFLESSPLAIVVACEGVDTWESDSAIVATFIQLCTVDLGLGSCWGHVANRVEDRVKELLKIP